MRICSGIQPSGKLHLGNYFGALRNWLQLQDEGNECYFFIADLHAHTQPVNPTQLSQCIVELAATLLAIGLNPEKVTLFVQSSVPAHTQLAWVLSCLAPFGEMERMIQFKEKAEHNPNAVNVGLFSYPILQAADILLYQADIVPVGVDQAQHLELTRTLARKFNNQFCPDNPLFIEPRTLHTPTPKIIGLDGQRKMSKSFDNYIALTETEESLRSKLRLAATDPARVTRSNPGTPEICNVFAWHQLFSPVAEQEWAAKGCRTAGIGCVECKGTLAKNLGAFIAPIRERYNDLMARPEYVREVLHAGAQKARAQADKVLERVYTLIGCSW